MPFEYVPLWTVADMVEYLLDRADLSGIGEERRKARGVILDAYGEFAQRDDWMYYRGRPGQITTEASQTDGSLAYDHSGGAEERLVTLTGATVPTNVEWYTVVIDSVHYEVERYISATTFTLTEGSNPGADVAAGTDYTLYRTLYPVPIDWRRGSKPIELNGWGAPQYVEPDELLNYRWLNNTPQSWQQVYTIRGMEGYYSGFVFEFAPPPSSAYTFNFVYDADPRPIGLFGTAVEYSTGTVSVAASTSASFATSVLEARMQGCVLRVTSSTTLVPTGRGGTRVTGTTPTVTDNPYNEQRILKDILTSTTATLDAATVGTYSAVKFTIGDPLDLDYHVMLPAFRSLCAWRFADAVGKERRLVENLEAAWRRDFGRARAADFRAPPDRGEVLPTPIYARLL